MQGTGAESGIKCCLRYRLYITQARFNETQGDLDGALAFLDEAESLYIRTPLPE